MTGRSRKRETPLCATWPNHRVYRRSYPSSIQSFRFLSREERSNSAHTLRSTITPLGHGRLLCASFSLLFSSLSPGPHRPAPRSLLTSDPEYCRCRSVVGVPRVCKGRYIPRMVYRCIPLPVPCWVSLLPVPYWVSLFLLHPVVYTPPSPGGIYASLTRW